MITILELLNRIRWDREYAQGDFAVGYYDRMEDRIIVVPFDAISFGRDDHFSFELTGIGGQTQTIPLHRVYEVYRNGKCIWKREHRQA